MTPYYHAVFLFYCLSFASAFHVIQPLRTSKSLSPHYSSQSDSNSIAPPSSTGQKAKTADHIKNEIRTLAKNTDNGLNAPEAVRQEIASCVEQLEHLFEANEAEAEAATTSLVSDPKLDGSWKLVYTTNGGSSAGKLGPFVGEVEQLICLSPSSSSSSAAAANKEDYYINYVRVGGNAIEGALSATWDVLDDKTWQVNFETIVFKLFGIKLLEKDLEAKGIWRKTYLDNDFRILHASAVTKDDDGLTEKKENVYILSK